MLDQITANSSRVLSSDTKQCTAVAPKYMHMPIADLLRPRLHKIHHSFAVPAAARLLRRVPFGLKKSLIQKALNAVFVEAIEDGDFDFLAENIVALHIIDLDEYVYISFDGELKILPKTATAQLRISGKLNDFVTLALRKEDPDTLFFQRRITIEGDTEMGLAVKNIIDAVDMEELPRSMRNGLAVANHIYRLSNSGGIR